MTTSSPKLPLWLATAILILGAAVFIARGPSRVSDQIVNMDSSLVPVASRAWANGESPYDIAAYTRARTAAGWPDKLDAAWRGPQAFVYPPSTYVLGAPIGMLPYPAARWVWNGLNILAFVLCIAGAAWLARIPLRSTWGLAAVGLGLAMAPSHTNIALGQTTVFVLAGVLGGLALREKKRPWLSGVSLGLACAIKPQTGLVFVGYELGRGRWKIALAAAACAVGLLAIGLARMRIAGIDGLAHWMANSRVLLETDANPIAPGIYAYRLIDLASPIAVLLEDVSTARILAVVLMAAAAFLYALIDWHRGAAKTDRPAELLSTSAVSVVMLLVCYHRLYDAVFLIFPLMLALAQLRDGDRRGWLTLLLLAPFFAPGASMLAVAEEKAIIPASLAANTVWKVLIVQHQTWTLCALLAWLIALRWTPSQSAPVRN